MASTMQYVAGGVGPGAGTTGCAWCRYQVITKKAEVAERVFLGRCAPAGALLGWDGDPKVQRSRGGGQSEGLEVIDSV